LDFGAQPFLVAGVRQFRRRRTEGEGIDMMALHRRQRMQRGNPANMVME
jgi:hypothetical protein